MALVSTGPLLIAPHPSSHSLRVTYATLLMEAGADLKTAMTLMRHSSPDLPVNRHAKPRRERLVELTEIIGEIARVEMERDPKCAASVLLKAVNLASGRKTKKSWWAQQDLNRKLTRTALDAHKDAIRTIPAKFKGLRVIEGRNLTCPGRPRIPQKPTTDP
jgi:hypothetical protein